MVKYNTMEIPLELKYTNPSENDVSILIGENGSGKSQLLSALATEYMKIGKQVIAISNSIHDKFPDSGKNLYLLRDRAGRQKVKRAIKNALLHIDVKEISRFKNVSEALRFVGYDPVIGIERVEISEVSLSIAVDENEESSIDKDEFEELQSLIYKSNSLSSGSIAWLSLLDFSFSEIDRISLIQLLKYENRLKKLELIDGIKLYLRKNDVAINLYDASSGELSFISSIIYLATSIDESSVILIDEPENSLHPSWQKDYVKILLDLFYLYQPKIILATHSALVVTGAEIANKQTNVFESRNFKFEKKTKEPVNIEEAFYSYFNVVTPENRFLSDHLVNKLNALIENSISYDAVITEIDRWKRKSFDPKQKDVLDGLKELAQKVNNAKSTSNE